MISPGGYNIVKTQQGKGVCVSLPTAYEGAYLDTYNLEISLKPTLKISRHNIPPFIPLSSLAEQSNMQTDLRGFLDTLSQHLNAFVCRKQQFKLVQVPVLFVLKYQIKSTFFLSLQMSITQSDSDSVTFRFIIFCWFTGASQVCFSDGKQHVMFKTGADVHFAESRASDPLHSALCGPHQVASNTSHL